MDVVRGVPATIEAKTSISLLFHRPADCCTSAKHLTAMVHLNVFHVTRSVASPWEGIGLVRERFEVDKIIILLFFKSHHVCPKLPFWKYVFAALQFQKKGGTLRRSQEWVVLDQFLLQVIQTHRHRGLYFRNRSHGSSGAQNRNQVFLWAEWLSNIYREKPVLWSTMDAWYTKLSSGWGTTS